MTQVGECEDCGAKLHSDEDYVRRCTGRLRTYTYRCADCNKHQTEEEEEDRVWAVAYGRRPIELQLVQACVLGDDRRTKILLKKGAPLSAVAPVRCPNTGDVILTTPIGAACYGEYIYRANRGEKVSPHLWCLDELFDFNGVEMPCMFAHR